MIKKEFLDILRQSLSGEVSQDNIEQNIRYYDQYISTQNAGDEEKNLSELGDPRLIARTIIESDRAAKQKGKYTGNQSNHSNNYTEEDQAEYNQSNTGSGSNMFFTNFKWYHKVIIALVLLLLLILIIGIGRFIIGFLFAFGVPILLVLLLMNLFRRR